MNLPGDPPVIAIIGAGEMGAAVGRRLRDDEVAGLALDDELVAREHQRSVAEALVDELGDDLFALAAEIEKLCTYVADRPCVELGDVRALVGHDHHCDVFALTDAVGRRDSARALGILADLVGAGEAPEMLVGQLGWQLRRLWTAKRLVQNDATPETVGRDLRIHPHFLDGFMDQVAHFSQLELARIFRQLVLTDLALKTGKLDRSLAMETFVVQACSRVALPGL